MRQFGPPPDFDNRSQILQRNGNPIPLTFDFWRPRKEKSNLLYVTFFLGPAELTRSPRIQR